MPAKETAEEKIARIVRETIAGEREREEEEKNPAYGKLRKMIREELGGALGDLLSDKGDAAPRGRRRPASGEKDDEGGEDEGGILKVLGLG